METPVGSLGIALASEHPGRVLFAALKREDPSGKREEARQVLASDKADAVAPATKVRHRHAGQVIAAECALVVLHFDLAIANPIRLFGLGVQLRHIVVGV